MQTLLTDVETELWKMHEQLQAAGVVSASRVTRLAALIVGESGKQAAELTAALAREQRLREVADELAKAIPCDHALHLISKARALNAYHAALAFDGEEGAVS
jgi:hypothetical protein